MKTNLLKPEHSRIKEKRIANILYVCIVIAIIFAAIIFLGGRRVVNNSSPSHQSDPQTPKTN